MERGARLWLELLRRCHNPVLYFEAHISVLYLTA